MDATFIDTHTTRFSYGSEWESKLTHTRTYPTFLHFLHVMMSRKLKFLAIFLAFFEVSSAVGKKFELFHSASPHRDI